MGRVNELDMTNLRPEMHDFKILIENWMKLALRQSLSKKVNKRFWLDVHVNVLQAGNVINNQSLLSNWGWLLCRYRHLILL